MAATADNWLVKSAGPFTESTANIVVLTRETVGWPLEACRTIRLQFDTLAGGTVDVEVLGPLDAWVDYSVGHAEDGIAEVRSHYTAIRCTFVGTGGAGRVAVQGLANCWELDAADLVDAVISVADAGGGATGAALAVDVRSLFGNAPSKECVLAISISDSQYAGVLDPNTNCTVGAPSAGSILYNGTAAGFLVIKTNAAGQFAVTISNAVDETVYFACMDAPGGAPEIPDGVCVRSSNCDAATWSA